MQHGSGVISTYQYEPLANGQIRLIELQPAQRFDDTIRLRVRNSYLDSCHPGVADCREWYVTLSYAWGEIYPDGSHLSDVVLRWQSIIDHAHTL